MTPIIITAAKAVEILCDTDIIHLTCANLTPNTTEKNIPPIRHININDEPIHEYDAQSI